MTFYGVEIVRMHQVGADAIQIAIFVTFVNECSKARVTMKLGKIIK